MSFTQFPCKNDPYLKKLRNEFKATPLAIPDSYTKPLQVIAHRGRKSINYGKFSELLKEKKAFSLKPEKEKIADVSLNSSIKMGANLGINILENIFKKFNISDIGLKPAFGNTQTMSIKFKKITKKFVTPFRIGSELNKHTLNTKHASLEIFTRNRRPFDMLLISSIYQCKSFEVELKGEKNKELDLNIPMIADFFSNTEFKLNTESANQKVMRFKGNKPLTFAFSCLELTFDEEGNIRLGEWVNPKNARGEGDVEEDTQDKEAVVEEISLMDEEGFGLLEWDKKDTVNHI